MQDKDFDGKFSERVRLEEHELHNGRCRIEGCYEPIHSFHHRLNNTSPNRKLYPLFLVSPMNCAGLCNKHHIHHASIDCLDFTEEEAALFERYLRDL